MTKTEVDAVQAPELTNAQVLAALRLMPQRDTKNSLRACLRLRHIYPESRAMARLWIALIRDQNKRMAKDSGILSE